jgi:hypothetical protein
VANFPGPSENDSLDPSELPRLNSLYVQKAQPESWGYLCAAATQRIVLSGENTMITTPAHLRSIVDHDGAVILDSSRNAMTILDATGAYIWDRLHRGMPPDSIAAELARDTGTDQRMIAKDVDVFMEQLKSKHLVTDTSGR